MGLGIQAVERGFKIRGYGTVKEELALRFGGSRCLQCSARRPI